MLMCISDGLLLMVSSTGDTGELGLLMERITGWAHTNNHLILHLCNPKDPPVLVHHVNVFTLGVEEGLGEWFFPPERPLTPGAINHWASDGPVPGGKSVQGKG